MFLIPLLLIVLIVWILSNNFKGSPSGTSMNTVYSNPVNPNRSLDILKERYAKSEITEEEYLRIKKDLG